MRVEIESVSPLEFTGGAPVRAASAIAPLGAGWLVAQDDATHAAWWRKDTIEPLRLFPPVEGHDVFEKEAGTKQLKPDLEAGCGVDVDGRPSALLLGSGSSDHRMRGALVVLDGDQPQVTVADLPALYAAVADALTVQLDELNMEGACVVGPSLRWFHRGAPAAGLPAASVDLDLAELLDVIHRRRDPDELSPTNVGHYDLGEVEGVGLAVTDAVTLLGGGTREPLVLVSSAAEDTADPREDGPVVGSALTLLDGTTTRATIALPELDGNVCKVEGLTVLEQTGTSARLLATVDADDHAAASLALRLSLRW